MANTFINTSWVTLDGLRRLKNQLVIAKSFSTDFQDQFKQEFPVGSSIQVPLPQRWKIRTGLTFTPEDIRPRTTTITMESPFGVDFEFDSVEQALNLERGDSRLAERYLKPAMEQLAQEVDSRCALFAYQNTPNIAGVLGTAATNANPAQAARTRLMQLACPAGDKNLFISPSEMESIVNGTTTLFNDQQQLSRAFKEGYLGRARGMDWSESMSLYRHTAGTWAGAVTVSGASQSGSTLNVNCTSGDTFRKGDVISIANVNAVNPATRRATGAVATFVITADVTAGGTTAALSIYPAINGPATDGGKYQNVDALPANLAALTLFPGTTSPSGKVGVNGLVIHKDAFHIVHVPFSLPKQSSMQAVSQTTDPDTGMTLSYIRWFDPASMKHKFRFDTHIGFGRGYSENCAVRILGA